MQQFMELVILIVNHFIYQELEQYGFYGQHFGEA